MLIFFKQHCSLDYVLLVEKRVKKKLKLNILCEHLNLQIDNYDIIFN